MSSSGCNIIRGTLDDKMWRRDDRGGEKIPP
jgi:hypothetical protein